MKNGRVVVSDDARQRRSPACRWGELGDDELCYVTAWWRLPVECTLGGRQIVEPQLAGLSTFAVARVGPVPQAAVLRGSAARALRPHGRPVPQPFVSGAHFFLNIAALPYHMAINPPHECQYALGYYRPGSCAPWMIPPIPLSLRGAAAEAMAIVGGVYLIP